MDLDCVDKVAHHLQSRRKSAMPDPERLTIVRGIVGLELPKRSFNNSLEVSKS